MIGSGTLGASFFAAARSAAALAAAAIYLLMSLSGTAFSTASPQEKKARKAEPPTAERKDQAEDQDEAVRLRSDLVVVTVTVTDESGKYVHGLAAKDLTVIEDDAPQVIDSFSAQEAPFAATILIDMSGSMEHKFGLVRGSAANFLEHIRGDDQVAVYGFNNKVRLFQDFSNSRDITDYIWDAKAEDTTRAYDCLSDAIDALAKREEKRRAILMISDGCDTSSQKASFDSVMKKAYSAGVTIYAVDLTESKHLLSSSDQAALLRRARGEMKEFANRTGGLYINSPAGENLESAFINIIEELRNQYTLTYYSTNNKHDGRWRKLSVQSSRPGLSIRSRRGYFAPKD